jgi:hypothetical protein
MIYTVTPYVKLTVMSSLLSTYLSNHICQIIFFSPNVIYIYIYEGYVEMFNVRSLCRRGSLKTVARELGKYKLDLVHVREVRWEKGGAEQTEDHTFFYVEGNEDHQLGTGFVVYKRIRSAVM